MLKKKITFYTDFFSIKTCTIQNFFVTLQCQIKIRKNYGTKEK